MPVVSSDLIYYLSGNRPTDDVSTSGGAIDTTARLLDQQVSANEAPSAVSDAAGDTAVDVTIVGRSGTGAEQTETNTLNGTTPVAFTSTFDRILSITLSGAATGTVTISNATDGTIHTFAPGELVGAILFQKADSQSGSAVTYYEKLFVKNTNGASALNAAELTLTADPTAVLQIAAASAKDDAESVANRATAPAAVSAFADDNTAVSVPTGILDVGEAIGVWFELSLSAGQAATVTSGTLQVSGTST